MQCGARRTALCLIFMGMEGRALPPCLDPPRARSSCPALPLHAAKFIIRRDGTVFGRWLAAAPPAAQRRQRGGGAELSRPAPPLAGSSHAAPAARTAGPPNQPAVAPVAVLRRYGPRTNPCALEPQLEECLGTSAQPQ